MSPLEKVEILCSNLYQAHIDVVLKKVRFYVRSSHIRPAIVNRMKEKEKK